MSARFLAHTALYTASQALLSTLLAVAVGIPLAFFISQRKFRGKRILSAMSSIPLCLPVLIMALGYIASFGMAGIYNRALMRALGLSNPPLTRLYSFWGIVMVQGFYDFPLIMKTVADGWSRIDRTLEESARLLGAREPRVFLTITLPQILPSVFSGCIPTFIYCFFSFMIVLLFGPPGGTTLEVAIYHAGRSTLNYKEMLILAAVETSMAFGMLLLYSMAERRALRVKSMGFVSGRNYEAEKKISGKDAVPLALLLILVLIFFLVPLLSIIISSLTVRTDGVRSLSLLPYKRLLGMAAFRKSFLTTICTATLSAMLSTTLGLLYAALVRDKFPRRQPAIIRAIPLLPMAVSSVVMAMALTMLVRRGTPPLLILAQAFLNWPFAYRQIHPHLSKIPQDVLDASRLLSRNHAQSFLRVVIPYGARGIISAFGFTFALSAGDASLPLVLAIPNFTTLSLLTFRLAGSYRFTEACCAGIILAALCTLVFYMADKIKGDAE